VAVSVSEIDAKSNVQSHYRGILDIRHKTENHATSGLDKTFTPQNGRLVHIDHCDRIVCRVGDKLVASGKMEGAMMAEANTLCKWIAEEISDEELIAAAEKFTEEEDVRKRFLVLDEECRQSV